MYLWCHGDLVDLGYRMTSEDMQILWIVAVYQEN